jgi:hypothetical protein
MVIEDQIRERKMRELNRRKFGSMEALRVMENQIVRDIQSQKATTERRIAALRERQKARNVPAGTMFSRD